MDPQKVRLTAGEIPGRYRIAGLGLPGRFRVLELADAMRGEEVGERVPYTVLGFPRWIRLSYHSYSLSWE